MICKYCGQKSPREFYEAAVELDEYKGKVLRLFGKTPEEIISVLEKEQPKMTREEARTKLECVGTVGKEAADFLLNIQALGLIKFDEKPLSLDDKVNNFVWGNFPALSPDNFCKALDKLGLVVVEKHPGDGKC